MNLAKVSAARQITVPIDICRLLNIQPGNKVLFMRKRTGEVVISNASTMALKEAQRAFRGAAKEMGVNTDKDVMNLVKEVRYGKVADV